MTGGISRAGTLLIAVLAALVLVSPALAKDGQAEVRVAHLAPDAPDADVYVDGEPVSELTDVPYGIVSAYLPLSPGSHSIQIYASKDAARPMVEAEAEFRGGTAYTVGVVGSTDDGAPTAEIYRDDNSIPPEGRAKLRVVNTSPDAGSVNVVPEGEGEKLVSDLEFPNASDYAEVPSGTSPNVSDYDVVTKAKGIEPWPLPMPIRASNPARLTAPLSSGTLRQRTSKSSLQWTTVLWQYGIPPWHYRIPAVSQCSR